MKGKTFHFKGRYGADIASPLQCKFEYTVLITVQTGYSSLLHFVANIDKEWLPDIRRP